MFRTRLAALIEGHDLLALMKETKEGEPWSEVAKRAWDTRGRKGEEPKSESRASEQPLKIDDGYFPGRTLRDREQYAALRTEWTKLSKDLQRIQDRGPDDPEVQQISDRMRGFVKDMYRLRCDLGGTEDIGLPGGPRDVVIIGAGPGGMSAAINAGSEGLDTLMIDANLNPGGQPKESSRVQNYPGFPAGARGRAIAERVFSQAERMGAETKLGVRVESITHDPATGLKTLKLSDGQTVEARSVIVATGLQTKKESFPGADAEGIVYGSSEALNAISEGKDVVISGGANSAAQAVLGASANARHITVISRSGFGKMSRVESDTLRLLESEGKLTILDGDEIARVDKNEAGQVTAVHTKKGRSVPAGAVGVFHGGKPRTNWLPKELKRHGPLKDVEEGNGFIEADPYTFETSIPGLFAIGDVRHRGGGRIAAAVGEGSKSIASVYQYLDKTRARNAETAAAR